MSLPNRPEAASWRGEAEASGESSPSRVSLASAPLASWSRGLLRNERARRRSLVTTTRTPRPQPWRRSSVAASPRRLPPSRTPLRTGTLLPRRTANATPPARPSASRWTTLPSTPTPSTFPPRRAPGFPFPPSPRRAQSPPSGPSSARWWPRTGPCARAAPRCGAPSSSSSSPSRSSRSCASRASSSPTRIEPPPSTARHASTRCRGADDSRPTVRGRTSSSTPPRAPRRRAPSLEPRRSTSRAATSTPSTLRRTRSPNFRTVSTLRMRAASWRSRTRFGTRTRASCSARRSRRRW